MVTQLGMILAVNGMLAPATTNYWEGLPHPLFESQAYEKALRSQPSTSKFEWSFYSKSKVLNRLQEVNLEPYWNLQRSEKLIRNKAGGFIPDFMVERDGKQLFVCLPANEIRLFENGKWFELDSMKLDLTPLFKLKEQVRTYRPAFTLNPSPDYLKEIGLGG